MNKPSKNTAKAFAVASTLASVIASNNTGDPKLTSLLVQCHRAMKVFNIKAGRKLYWEISHHIQKIWEKLSLEHRTEIDYDKVPIFIEYLCIMIPPKDFKTFLGIDPYTTNETLDKDTNKQVVDIVLELDKELNDFFNTKPYSLSKPKEKKIKQKRTRDISKKQSKHDLEVINAKAKKERKQEFFAQIRAKAKAQKEQNETSN